MKTSPERFHWQLYGALVATFVIVAAAVDALALSWLRDDLDALANGYAQASATAMWLVILAFDVGALVAWVVTSFFAKDLRGRTRSVRVLLFVVTSAIAPSVMAGAAPLFWAMAGLSAGVILALILGLERALSRDAADRAPRQLESVECPTCGSAQVDRQPTLVGHAEAQGFVCFACDHRWGGHAG